MTCIIPVYNGERFLSEALESVLDQRFPDLEAVVVDDGSTDTTPDILASFGDRIRVIRQKNSGDAAARNRGLREATGELISFQDADDLWMPGKLEKQVRRFAARPELEMCLGMVQNFWEEELEEEGSKFQDHPFSKPVPGYILQCLLARRSLFDRVGPFSTNLPVASDNDWFLRARDSGAVEELLPEVLVHRRLHLSNLTREDLACREQLLQNMKASLDRRRKPSGP